MANAPNRLRWKLYWVQTEDHDEDWFVVARNWRQAASFHDDYNGYDAGDSYAELVAVLPPEEQGFDQPGYAGDGLIEVCGGKFLDVLPDRNDAARALMGSEAKVVGFKGKVYRRGDIVRNVCDRLGLPST